MDEMETAGTVRPRRRIRWRRWLAAGGVATVAAICLTAWANAAARRAAEGRLFDEASQVTPGGVALVFGCNDRVKGRENLYFRYRMESAAALWQAGKVRGLIVSGDNRHHGYNEAHLMRDALVARGVPADHIVCDYAGLSTLDSVVRVGEIFGVDRVVFVSQRFQNERAAYLARAHGIEFQGVNARDVSGSGGVRTKVREVGARVKMWADVHVLKSRPRHLGAPETLPF